LCANEARNHGSPEFIELKAWIVTARSWRFSRLCEHWLDGLSTFTRDRATVHSDGAMAALMYLERGANSAFFHFQVYESSGLNGYRYHCFTKRTATLGVLVCACSTFSFCGRCAGTSGSNNGRHDWPILSSDRPNIAIVAALWRIV
jgi:hypothetical protein